MPETIHDVPALKRLWVHEVLRVYYDRLIDDQDRHWLYEYLQEVTKSKLNENFHKLLGRLANDKGKVTEHELRSFMYCDFSDPKADQRFYSEVTNLSDLRKIVEGFLDEYNGISKKTMNLVLFRYLCIHF